MGDADIFEPRWSDVRFTRDGQVYSSPLIIKLFHDALVTNLPEQDSERLKSAAAYIIDTVVNKAGRCLLVDSLDSKITRQSFIPTKQVAAEAFVEALRALRKQKESGSYQPTPPVQNPTVVQPLFSSVTEGTGMNLTSVEGLISSIAEQEPQIQQSPQVPIGLRSPAAPVPPTHGAGHGVPNRATNLVAPEGFGIGLPRPTPPPPWPKSPPAIRNTMGPPAAIASPRPNFPARSRVENFHAKDSRQRTKWIGPAGLSKEQIEEAIPENASCTFHIFDRRINFDSHASDASLYSLVRSWAQDDPYRRTQPSGFAMNDTHSVVSYKPDSDGTDEPKKRPLPSCDVASELRKNHSKEKPSADDLRNSLLEEAKQVKRRKRKEVKKRIDAGLESLKRRGIHLSS